MNRAPHLILALLVSLSPLSQAADLIGVTQKKSGKTIQVEVIKLSDGQLTFKTQNGKTHSISTDTITAKSLQNAREYLSSLSTKKSNSNAKINKAIAHPLFDGTSSLWDQSASDIAKRLRWPKESQTNQSSSYRYYSDRNLTYQFLGAHPYCATLYGDKEGKASHISLVFANKGDFGSTAGFGPDHFKKINPGTPPPTTLTKAIELDAQFITTSLTECLGEPKKQYYGEKEDRRKVLRWDLNDHSFLLSEIKDEYTSLLIVPKDNADHAGKVHLVKDSELKKIVSKNVTTEDNGDTLIKNIPMVNQGPKGYCAPATFERAMRYMLVPADMYLLATAATKPGGGTYTELLADSCKRIVRSKARRIKDLDLDKDLKIRHIKKYIDKGVPVLWQMRSLDQYNQIADTRTKQRAQVSDFSKWATEIEQEAQQAAPSMEHNDSNHHICMIIGYNESTHELAVSDSWGRSYELRWIHIDIAKAVTEPGGFVIDL